MARRVRYEEEAVDEGRRAALQALDSQGVDVENPKVQAWADKFAVAKLNVDREMVPLRRLASRPEGVVYQAARDLFPQIGRAREDVFRCEGNDPPFRSLREAAAWIRAHADPTVGENLIEEMDSLDPPTLMDVSLHLHTLAFYAAAPATGGVRRTGKAQRTREARNSGKIETVLINPLDHGNAVTALSGHVGLIEGETGWSQPDVVALIMIGRLPEGGMRAEVEWTPQKGIPRLHLTLWPWHVQALAPLLRRDIPQHVLERFTWSGHPEGTAKLLAVMDRIGYPSEDRHQYGYWVKLVSAWRQEYGTTMTPDALRVRWNRLPQKVRNSLRSGAVSGRETPGPSPHPPKIRPGGVLDVPTPGHRWRGEGQLGPRVTSDPSTSVPER